MIYTTFYSTNAISEDFCPPKKKTAKHNYLAAKSLTDRARQDSNLQPSDSKSATLSN